MTIMAFDDATRTGQAKRTFVFQYNPNTYKEKHVVQFCERQPKGPRPTELVFNRVPLRQWNFEILLDSTGASSPSEGGGLTAGLPGFLNLSESKDVREKVNDFLETTHQVNGKIHRPHFLSICWGQAIKDDVLPCVMLSADVTYTLFKPDATPIRAKISAVFRESRKTVSKAEERLESPDLTHIRSVAEADNLPVLSDQVYDSPSHYIELAKANRLKNFRRLRVGQELRFPPVRPADSSS